MDKLSACLLVLVMASVHLHAQCFVLADCPAAPDTVCDPAFNNAQFWNETYWFDAVYNSHDLAEGSVDLPVYVLDSCGTDSVHISFVLFLDLNNDGLRETAVPSASLPPANTVYYGNAANPGYTGGMPRNFDERLVTMPQKYRFALIETRHDDTLVARVRWINTAASPDTINARLPAGTHRIEWRLQQGMVVKTCQYDFTVRDCVAPAVLCKPGYNVNIDPNGQVVVTLPSILASVADNYAPTSQIQLSLQTGDIATAFPLDSSGNVVQQLSFNCMELGFHLVELWAKDQAGLASHCQSYVIVGDTAFVCSPPPPVIAEICVKHFCGGLGVDGVKFEVQGGNPAFPPTPIFGNSFTDTSGCMLLSNHQPLLLNSLFFARKNDNPINGVSTFDLVLMSRHILGLQPLDSPYKLIAADVNRSNSLTTFDIVELRKLILGIYQELPNNTSWRFVDAAFAFPNPDNPFQTAFPESVPLGSLLASTASADFYGVKVGDVNCSALSYLDAPPEDRAPSVLWLPDMALAAGEIIDVPVHLTEAGAWFGWQGSLVFDARKLEMAEITSTLLPAWSAGNQASWPGQTNLSWSGAAPVLLLPDDTVLTLHLRALAPLLLRDVLALGTVTTGQRAVLPAEAYGADESRLGLALQFVKPDQITGLTAEIFAAQPNPTSAGAQIPLRLLRPETVTVEITDLTGRLLYRSSSVLAAGPQQLEIPARVLPQPGLYGWRVLAGASTRSGKLVKI